MRFNSIDALVEHTVREFAPLPAFSFKSGFRTKTYTFAESFSSIQRFPAFFKSNGISQGDKVIVLSLNRPEYALLIFGALWSGVTLVPIDYRTNQETIEKFIRKTQAKAVFTTRPFESLFANVPLPHFFLETILNDVGTFKPHPRAAVDPIDVAAILFTSGTTGEPKGTVITYKNIIASVSNAREAFPLPAELRLLSILPLSHALEMFGGMMTAFSWGCHVHYIERINSITIIHALRRYRIQAMAVVPQMLRLILQNIERTVADQGREQEWQRAQQVAPRLPRFVRRILFRSVLQGLGGSLEFFVCGSAPLELKVAKLWENMGVRVIEGYGASETTGFVSSNTFAHQKLGTVGKLFSGMETKRGESGELWVRGDNVISGYFENDEQTAAAFTDGWFKTGDIVNIDEGGYFTITGRDKFKIVLADGKKVYPEDIEKKLNNDSRVIDSTVFGLQTDDGEVVHAELILKNPNDARAVIDQVNAMLNPHEQVLDYGVFPEKDFPRTKTLKVDREAVKLITLAHRSPDHESANAGTPVNTDIVDKILRTVSGKEDGSFDDNTTLATDLKLDSLKRVELLALVEEEIGVSVSEVDITPHTTVAELRALIKNGKPVSLGDGFELSNWQFSNTMGIIRVILQDCIAFPLAWIVARITVVHPERVRGIKTPQLFVFNHVGMYDVYHDYRVLPASIRRHTAVATTSEVWGHAWQIWIVTLFANCFPFIRAEEGNGNNATRGNFERVGEILDRGFNIFIAPEARITTTGELSPFHTGVGYIAIEMNVPVTVFKLNGYFELWPEDKTRTMNMFWPNKFGRAEVVISDPIVFKPGTSYEEATELVRQTMLNLK